MAYLKMAVFASHGGSNLQAILDACKTGKIRGKVALVISNNSKSYALERAKKEGIPHYHISHLKYPSQAQLDEAILEILAKYFIDLIVLAGYMKKLGADLLASYKGKILNIHPALLPKYGGQGMYGQAIHKAVLEAGDEKTGVTIHLVDADYDTGPIVRQEELAVLPGDTLEGLTARVLLLEHQLYVETLRLISIGEIDLEEISK